MRTVKDPHKPPSTYLNAIQKRIQYVQQQRTYLHENSCSNPEHISFYPNQEYSLFIVTYKLITHFYIHATSHQPDPKFFMGFPPSYRKTKQLVYDQHHRINPTHRLAYFKHSYRQMAIVEHAFSDCPYLSKHTPLKYYKIYKGVAHQTLTLNSTVI